VLERGRRWSAAITKVITLRGGVGELADEKKGSANSTLEGTPIKEGKADRRILHSRDRSLREGQGCGRR